MENHEIDSVKDRECIAATAQWVVFTINRKEFSTCVLTHELPGFIAEVLKFRDSEILSIKRQ